MVLSLQDFLSYLCIDVMSHPFPHLHRFAMAAVGVANWGTLVDPQLVANLGRYRRYQFRSLRDLLRVVRNKKSHFREMPMELQVGS